MMVSPKIIIFTKLFCYYCIISSGIILICDGFNCELPEGCRLEMVYFRENIWYHEKGENKYLTIMCDVKDEH